LQSHTGKGGGYDLRCMQQHESVSHHVSGEQGAADWIFSCLSLHADGQLAPTGYTLDPVHERLCPATIPQEPSFRHGR
jgi:hypothetical protein